VLSGCEQPTAVNNSVLTAAFITCVQLKQFVFICSSFLHENRSDHSAKKSKNKAMSKAKMHTKPDGLNLTIVKLAIRRMAVKIFDQQLEPTMTKLPVLELHASAQ
jgi:hypothetical protein